eukprot:TRINITY_DN10981_c0_g1_i1.p1 TRINITY_DN10981_c0_g1~~TRINITY_DN10981_c0_g1_i1.p1  ORF type:complete len:242 (-),score=56.63 TRINITY_DN10981_c0_g1_i1:93-818(-)
MSTTQAATSKPAPAKGGSKAKKSSKASTPKNQANAPKAGAAKAAAAPAAGAAASGAAAPKKYPVRQQLTVGRTRAYKEKAPTKRLGKRNATGTNRGAIRLAQTEKALKVAKTLQKGRKVNQTRKVRTSVHFYRPKTVRSARHPRYPRFVLGRNNHLDQFDILRHPLTSETAMKKIEETNTLVFIVDLQANKHQIAAAVKQMYGVLPVRVNTLIKPDGEKKAFIKLAADVDGLDVASKIGII